MVYEFKCLPPNEPYRIVRLEAASIAEAVMRAEALWCHQSRPPQLLAMVDTEPQVALAFG